MHSQHRLSSGVCSEFPTIKIVPIVISSYTLEYCSKRDNLGQDSLNIYTMITWKKFLEQMEGTPEVDEQQIDRLYDKSKIAVDLVRQYNPKLLFNITTIADLASGAYGIYSSGENKKLLPQPLEQQLVYYGKVGRHNLDLVPKITIQRYYPDVPADQIKQSDTIHVNIRRILQESQNDLEAILQIASTIVHEATHEIEFELVEKHLKQAQKQQKDNL